ncbi:unnamed protein product [Auanema sp. JU1783]|nr:unnamed protein product [Auanema sp. JU1783]
MLFFFVFVNLFFNSHSVNWKAVNLNSQTVYEFDSEHAPPTSIGRLRINVTNIDQEKSSNDPLIVYIVRLRWKTPLRWNENSDNKTYDTICELQDHLQDKGVTIIDRSVPSDVNGLDERFSLPSSLFSLICAVRPRNARYAASWTYSKLVTIDSSLRNDDRKENGTATVTGDTEDDEANDTNPLTEVTIMKEHIATINDRPFLDLNNSNETGVKDDDEKKSLLDLLKMSKLTLIEDGQPIRTRPTNLTIQVKPDITEDRPPLFSQSLQLHVGKSSEVITRLLMRTDVDNEPSNDSNSSELEPSSPNSTVVETNNGSQQKVLEASDLDVVENSTTTVPETALFTDQVLKIDDNNTMPNLSKHEEGELSLLQTGINEDNIEGGGAPSDDIEGLNEAAFAFESRVFDDMEDGIVTGKPLDLEEDFDVLGAEKSMETFINSPDFSNATIIEDLSAERTEPKELDPENVNDRLFDPLNVTTTTEGIKEKSEFRQPTADEISDSQEEPEKKTSIVEVLSDYDTLETEIRAAIGADEENLERLKQLFSGGFPEGLLRVL